jgi:hypothetical protein
VLTDVPACCGSSDADVALVRDGDFASIFLHECGSEPGTVIGSRSGLT